MFPRLESDGPLSNAATPPSQMDLTPKQAFVENVLTQTTIKVVNEVLQRFREDQIALQTKQITSQNLYLKHVTDLTVPMINEEKENTELQNLVPMIVTSANAQLALDQRTSMFFGAFAKAAGMSTNVRDFQRLFVIGSAIEPTRDLINQCNEYDVQNSQPNEQRIVDQLIENYNTQLSNPQ